MISTKDLMSLHEYICDLCVEKGTSIDLRWRCFGDRNKYYINNEYFSIDCDEYYEPNIENIRKLFDIYISVLCERFMQPPKNKIAMYIEDIIYEDEWYKIIVGACTFKDDAL